MRRRLGAARRTLALAIVTGWLTASACSPLPVPQAEGDEEPPPAPPLVTIGEVPVPVLAAEWFAGQDGSISTQRPDDPQDTSTLPRVIVDGGRLRVGVVPGTLPRELDVQFFLGVDEAGLPVDAQEAVRCADLDGECRWTTGRDWLAVLLRPPDQARFMTVTLTYEVPLFPSAAPPTSRATYAVFLD